MSPSSPNTFYKVIQTLNKSNIPLENLIRRSLVEPGIADSPFIDKFVDDLPRLLGWLAHHERTRGTVKEWVKHEFTDTLTSQLRDLTRRETGLHFNAGTITVERMKDCTIEKIAKEIRISAPDLWNIVGSLLESDPVIIHRREKARAERAKKRNENEGHHKGAQQTNVFEDDDDDKYPFLNYSNDGEDEPEDLEEQLETQRRSLLHIKQVTCISIMMQATNQRCNSLQALIGIFLQSCNVSDHARNFLARLGLSVSVTTISRAMKNLSHQAYKEMQRLGSTFLASYAYDNLDVDLVHSTPSVETATKDTLVHLTTASMFPLHPTTTNSHLDFSDCLRDLQINPPIPSSITDILVNLPPVFNKLDSNNRSIQHNFNRWKFLGDLIAYGPVQFMKFKPKLGDPEEIDCIPLTKTKQVPLRASRTGPSTPAKNATVLEEFFRQSNIGEPTSMSGPNPVHPGNNIILVHGDLLTGQHLQSLRDSRIDDLSPGLRFQSQLFCHGWFHARMACADAIWRRHIKSSDSENESANIIKYITQIRPLEKHKILTNPTFRQLHEVITHVGIVLRLDAWRVQVSRRYPQYQSLEEWVNTNPTWEELVEIANELVTNFVGLPDLCHDFRKDDNERDKVFEKTKAYHKDFLLYEETNYSMNHGDFGRLDACLSEWVFYFMGCGKTKYAQEILHYLENMYILYPKLLADAIHMNSLVNPTGRKDHFRGVDWVIEHNNLYIKRIFGGSGSNHTVDRMIEASPLIEVYKDVREQFEKMFCLSHKTSRHSPPKMKLTFEKLRKYMERQNTNRFTPGWETEQELMDTMQIGIVKLTKSTEESRKRWRAERETQKQLRIEKESKANPSTETQLNIDEVPDIVDDDEADGDPNDEASARRLEDDDRNLFIDETFN